MTLACEKALRRRAAAEKECAEAMRLFDDPPRKKVLPMMSPAEKARQMVGGARSRAKVKDIPFRLNEESLLEIQSALMGGRCEMSGVRFEFGGPPLSPFAPSLDRIEPARGYVPGNIRVVCWLMNAAMSAWGEDTLREVMEAWLGPPRSQRDPIVLDFSDIPNA